MLTGQSQLLYTPNQPSPPQVLVPDKSYFLIKLHDVQVYFASGFFSKPGFVTITTSIGTGSIKAEETKSLHQVSQLKKNIAMQIGFRINLTDWLPAVSDNSVHITLKYIVTKASPFKELAGKIDQIDLVAKASLVGPQLAVATKVSQITGQLLSYLMEEGKTDKVFDLKMDQNIIDLKSGYYVIFGSPYGVEQWPTPSQLKIGDNGVLSSTALPLNMLSYAIFNVLVRPRRGEEIARNEAWWELLQVAKEEVLAVEPMDDKQRQNLWSQWNSNLTKIQVMARKAQGYLLEEIKEILRKSQTEIKNHLDPIIQQSDQELPEVLQDILGVRTEQELYVSVQDYEDALKVSNQLLDQYDL